MPRDPRLDQIMEAIGRTPYADSLSDPNRRHEMLFRALADSDDPVTREIGEQLRTGVRPHQLLTEPAYRQFLTDALATANRLDLDRLHDDADTAAEAGRLTGDLDRDLHTTEPPRRDPDNDDRR